MKDELFILGLIASFMALMIAVITLGNQPGGQMTNTTLTFEVPHDGQN